MRLPRLLPDAVAGVARARARAVRVALDRAQRCRQVGLVLAHEADVGEVVDDEVARAREVTLRQATRAARARPVAPAEGAAVAAAPAADVGVAREPERAPHFGVVQPLAQQPAREGRAPGPRARRQPRRRLVLLDARAAVVAAVLARADLLARERDQASE